MGRFPKRKTSKSLFFILERKGDKQFFTQNWIQRYKNLAIRQLVRLFSKEKSIIVFS